MHDMEEFLLERHKGDIDPQKCRANYKIVDGFVEAFQDFRSINGKKPTFRLTAKRGFYEYLSFKEQIARGTTREQICRKNNCSLLRKPEPQEEIEGRKLFMDNSTQTQVTDLECSVNTNALMNKMIAELREIK